MRGTMEELHGQPGTLIEGKPKKVRFKLASSYSGRVLKHVYEDGQELDSPEEQYPHSFIHNKMEMGHLCGLEDMQDQSFFPPTGLIAQRINVYRGVTGCNSLACGDLPQDNKVSPALKTAFLLLYFKMTVTHGTCTYSSKKMSERYCPDVIVKKRKKKMLKRKV